MGIPRYISESSLWNRTCLYHSLYNRRVIVVHANFDIDRIYTCVPWCLYLVVRFDQVTSTIISSCYWLLTCNVLARLQLVLDSLIRTKVTHLECLFDRPYPLSCIHTDNTLHPMHSKQQNVHPFPVTSGSPVRLRLVNEDTYRGGSHVTGIHPTGR